MTYGNMRGAKQYGQVAVQSDIAYASPHRIIQMLLIGALDKIAAAKGHLVRGDIKQKGAQITWAMSIINGLRMSLDHKDGGEITANLDNLYEYMSRRLLQANVENNVGILDEVSGLLREIKAAWDAIPEEAKALRPGPEAPATPGVAAGR